MIMSDNDLVIQYIIVRNDLASMTPGRVAAQAAHAANQCIKTVDIREERAKVDPLKSLVLKWEIQSHDFFGTTIVLQGNIQNILDIAWMVQAPDLPHPDFIIHSGILIDPEYHVQDGEVTHLLPLTTAMWLFGRKSVIEPHVLGLELY
jgi:peptidyl-tRNA hydrolase